MGETRKEDRTRRDGCGRFTGRRWRYGGTRERDEHEHRDKTNR